MLNPAPINVHINVFQGPMDLLLHLIKKDNLDICDINIAEITKQYLDYLNVSYITQQLCTLIYKKELMDY